jgi:pyrroline-5-carboxylate reductase
MPVRLSILGGGRMGEALARGLRSSGWAAPGEVVVVEPSAERRAELADLLDGVSVEEEPVASEGVVVAVKPGDVAAACAAAARAGAERVLSIAAGVTLADLEAAVGDVPVVRAMPNTPCLVGAGAAAIAGGDRVEDDDLVWAEGILGSVGVVVRVPEHLLDAVTGLSGSGPAYVFLVVEALIEAGVLAGLPRAVATTLATQTVLGSAQLLVETGETPEVLRAAVTSPGGTTAAGLRALEASGTRSAVLEAVMAAADRSRQLGG